jgi:hypothetical protein
MKKTIRCAVQEEGDLDGCDLGRTGRHLVVGPEEFLRVSLRHPLSLPEFGSGLLLNERNDDLSTPGGAKKGAEPFVALHPPLT